MERVVLGNTGIEVTKLCFGALPLGPLQKNLSVEEGSEVIAYALESGIDFIDTAQMYRTYPYIKKALEKTDKKPVIASKSAADDYEGMEKAILEALFAMGVEYIDIFHLHAARAQKDVFEKRKGALECLQEYKTKGVIKAVGISTHSVKTVEAAAAREDIDVVFPLLNKIGRGILDGDQHDMEKAIAGCYEKGKGIYLMKVIGGGTMIGDYAGSLEYAMNLGGNYPIAIGMVSKEEVRYNIAYFNGEQHLEDIITTNNNKNLLIVKSMCAGCGSCIEACHSGALAFDTTGKACIDPKKCLQCGYCVAACPQFCIRLV